MISIHWKNSEIIAVGLSFRDIPIYLLCDLRYMKKKVRKYAAEIDYSQKIRGTLFHIYIFNFFFNKLHLHYCQSLSSICL